MHFYDHCSYESYIVDSSKPDFSSFPSVAALIAFIIEMILKNTRQTNEYKTCWVSCGVKVMQTM